MSWLYLVLAIVLEVAGTTSMKWSQGFTQTWPSVLMFLCYGLSLSALTTKVQRRGGCVPRPLQRVVRRLVASSV
jgi:small multidrug resistance pump